MFTKYAEQQIYLTLVLRWCKFEKRFDQCFGKFNTSVIESKTNALVLLVIAVVLLSVAIGSKVISDKKRKSMEISTAERRKNDDNEPHDETIKPKSKMSCP